MKLSAPLYYLKRKARLAARAKKIPLGAALDAVARQEGHASWSLLAAAHARARPAATVLAGLAPGDLLLLGARPGQGKTLFSLELALEAMKAGRPAKFFTLEYAPGDVLARLRELGAEPARFAGLFDIDCSDAIDAGHIIAACAAAPPGALLIVDYLQLLDQRRDKPDLSQQVRALKAFAAGRGLIAVFISQIDRAYDSAQKSGPGIEDVRLPNPLDLRLFDKTCFLNAGVVRFQAAA